jgi:hypothetical protein
VPILRAKTATAVQETRRQADELTKTARSALLYSGVTYSFLARRGATSGEVAPGFVSTPE